MKLDTMQDLFTEELHDLHSAAPEAVCGAFRLDKGRRVLCGMLQARDSSFFMIVDDDDLVSNAIMHFVAQHSSSFGWTIDRG